MKREAWEKRIKEQIKINAEYLPAFETTICILAEILEERDNVHAEYQKDGSRPVIIFTSDRGAENLKPNPLLKQWQELNTTALAYLRDLGLTAAGLRKLQGQLPKEEKRPSKIDAFFSRERARDPEEKREPAPRPQNDKEKAEAMGISFDEYLSMKQKEAAKK